MFFRSLLLSSWNRSTIKLWSPLSNQYMFFRSLLLSSWNRSTIVLWSPLSNQDMFFQSLLLSSWNRSTIVLWSPISHIWLRGKLAAWHLHRVGEVWWRWSGVWTSTFKILKPMPLQTFGNAMMPSHFWYPSMSTNATRSFDIINFIPNQWARLRWSFAKMLAGWEPVPSLEDWPTKEFQI